MTTPEDADPAPEARAPRWFQRVLPTTALGVALLGAAVLVVPGFRDQMVLSVTHRPESYVELYFGARTVPARPVGCVRRGASAVVRFTVASHLRDDEPVAYRVAADPAGAVAAHHRRGRVQLAAGAAREVRTSFRVPRGTRYRVSVDLPAFGQSLRADCGGRPR